MDDLRRLVPGYFYHIYNRGNNRENLFQEPDNYRYFLACWLQHIHPVAETYAYALLKNHFHVLVCIRPLPALLQLTHMAACANDPTQLSNRLSRCFSNCFNAYAKAMNKRYQRSGSLFQERFRRKLVMEEDYLTGVILYIHFNALRHRLVNKRQRYPFTSYEALLSDKPTRLQRQKVLGLFGGRNAFVEAHQRYCENLLLKKIIFEKEDDDEE